MLAEERLRLIQDYTEFVRLESRRLGKKFRKSKAVREFCGEEGISPATLYRYIQRYQQGGGEALVSKYGLRKGKGPVVEKILPLLKEALEPGKGYSGNLVKLAQICSERGVEVPNYSTFRNIVIRNGLSGVVARQRKPIGKPDEVICPDDESDHPWKPAPLGISEQLKGYPPQSVMSPMPRWLMADAGQKAYRVITPDWIRVVNKKAFNVAICKYSLILPFLNPDLDPKEKTALLNEIVKKSHQPLPGIKVKLTRSSLLSIINVSFREWEKIPRL
jgi:transposase-like protein